MLDLFEGVLVLSELKVVVKGYREISFRIFDTGNLFSFWVNKGERVERGELVEVNLTRVR